MWKPVDHSDEYAHRDDTHTVTFGKWLYFWSDKTKTLRRYGKDGEYQECTCRHRPELAGEGAAGLSARLQSIFAARRTSGTLVEA